MYVLFLRTVSALFVTSLDKANSMSYNRISVENLSSTFEWLFRMKTGKLVH